MQKTILLALLLGASVGTAASVSAPISAASVTGHKFTDTGTVDTEDASYRRYSPAPTPSKD